MPVQRNIVTASVEQMSLHGEGREPLLPRLHMKVTIGFIRVCKRCSSASSSMPGCPPPIAVVQPLFIFTEERKTALKHYGNEEEHAPRISVVLVAMPFAHHDIWGGSSVVLRLLCVQHYPRGWQENDKKSARNED